jgi:UDP-2,3-diacylglucosamine pyrophosphatase LpxH
MDQNSIRAMIVFSDTHLGLARWKLGIFENTVESRPRHVHQFVRWLLDLQITTSEEVLVGNELGQICPKKLLSPDELVLNGDILELWDASDRAVDLSSQSIFQDLMQLRCQKWYLTGNHDFAIQQVKGSYPWGNSGLNILPDTYPEMEGEDIETVKVGENHYLILHGHQLSKTFRIAPWQIVSMLRDGAEAFRSYSWILVALLSIMLVASIFFPLLTPAIPLLAALAFPRLFVSIARPIWNYFNKKGRHRYNTNASAKGFVDWWKILLQKKKNPTSRIHIVYGHTHLMNLISNKQDLEEIVGSKIDGPDLVLINHGAWVKDTKYENVRQAIFLYIDAEGFEFFGWDWNRKRPFHIPKRVIPILIKGKPIDPPTEKWLHDLEWPDKLIIKMICKK